MNELKQSLFLDFVTSPRPFPELTTVFLVTLGVFALDHPMLALTEALAAVC